MGWYTTLVTTINFSKKTYNSIGEVQDELDGINHIIESYKTELHSLIITTEPKKIMSAEDLENSTPLDWLNNRFEVIMEELANLYIERDKLDTLLEEWDNCHDENGLAIPLLKPTDKKDEHGCTITEVAASEAELKNLSYGTTSFLDGDFIKTIYDNKEHAY